MSTPNTATATNPSTCTTSCCTETATAKPVAQIGAFCWIELHTRDRATARAFFTKVIGWTIAPCDKTAPEATIYEEWVAQDGAHVGGMMTMPAAVPAYVPSHFATYVNVADVDATAARVAGLGGTVLMPPMDIPEVGRFAVIADPTGATLNIFKGVGTHGSKDSQARSAPGHFCWNELSTNDPAKSRAFYTALRGYGAMSMPMPTGEYTMFSLPGTTDQFVGGMMQKPTEAGSCPSCWLAYVHVANVDTVAKSAVREGGKVLFGPSDVPGFGRSAVIADPTGAPLGLFTPAA